MNVVGRRIPVVAALAYLVVASMIVASPVAASSGVGEPVTASSTANGPADASPSFDGTNEPPLHRCCGAILSGNNAGKVPGVDGYRNVEAATEKSGRDRSRGGSIAGAADNITLTQSLALTPDRPGEITVTLSFDVPDQVTKLSTEVPTDATVVETTEFSAAGETRYEWTGTATSPSLTYRLPANATGGETRSAGTASGYYFVDAGPWALVRIPATPTSWSWRGDRAQLVRERTTDGPGAIGSEMAYLGEHTVHTKEANGQQFRLVVPDAASMRESPDSVLGGIGTAAEAIRIGGEDESVFMVAAPTESVDWGVRGFQTGSADLWVRDRARIDAGASVWIHEYVHTRQTWAATEATRWVREATATYFATLLGLQRGHTSYSAFRDYLAAGAQSPQSTSILARPDTWRNNANYQKGALVAGELDRQIRLASDGERSLQHVLRAMNEHDEPITQATFLSIVAHVSNSSVREAARRYTTSEAAPSTWSPDTHETAFGERPSSVEIVPADRHSVNGTYRNRSIGSEPINLVPGETLTVAAVARNAGGAAGSYETTASVDGEPRATRSGTVGPDETERLSYSHTFTTVGSHDVTIGDVTFEIQVHEPVNASVTDVSVDRSTVGPGESVALTATVQNDADIPAEKTVTFRVDGQTVATRELFLDAGERRQLTATTSFDAPGSYQVDAAGGEQITVRVVQSAATTSTPTPASANGFGLVAALIGIALVVSAIRAGRSDGGVLAVQSRRER